MTFHVLLLFLLTAVQGLYFIANGGNNGINYALCTVYNIGDTVVCCMIAYIVWSVSDRHESVSKRACGQLNHTERPGTITDEAGGSFLKDQFEGPLSQDNRTTTSMGSFLDEVALEDSFAARTIAHFIDHKATEIEGVGVTDNLYEVSEHTRSKSMECDANGTMEDLVQ